MFNKDIEELKNKQSTNKNTVTEIKNTLEGNHSRVTEAEEHINELEDRRVEIMCSETTQ